MEPDESITSPSQMRDSRHRSRLPSDSEVQREAPGHGQKRAGSFDDPSPSEVKRLQVHPQPRDIISELMADLAEFDAEDARRQGLSPEERLKEDGGELRRKIEADPQMFVALERSRSSQARCRAQNDCIYLRANARSGNAITTPHRICLHGVQNMEWYGRTKHYYHVPCFSLMVPLRDLLPSKLKMDGSSGRWGLMVEKWFEHAGRIDLGKIAAFLEERAVYEAKQGGWSAEYITWSSNHRRNCGDKEAGCKCPAQPQPPEEPELRDYTTEDGVVCTLLDVLRHPLVDKMADG